MKQKLITFFATLLCSMFLAITHAQAAQVYTVYDASTKTLIYYYGNNYDAGNPYHELYDPVNNPKALRFEAYHGQVKRAVIHPSMKNAPLTSMRRMFYGGFNSETKEYYSLTNMTAIEGLEYLNTSNTTDMEFMFFECQALEFLNLSSFNTAKVTNMHSMFWHCNVLTTLDLMSFNTAKVTDMRNMFDSCYKLTSLDLSSFDISKVTDMSYMFYGCSKLTTIYCNDDWSTSATLTSSQKMFYYCKALVGGKGTTYDAEVIDKTYARPDGGPEAPGYFTKRTVYTVYDDATQTLTYYYDSNYNAANTYHEVYDPINLHDAVRFTEYYDKVKKVVIDPSMKNAPLTSTRKMFQGGFNEATNTSQSLTSMTTIVGLENLNTSKMTSLTMMFFKCPALKSVDLTSFDISKVTDMSHMFNGCSSLTTIYCNDDWSKSAAVKDSKYMFADCTALVGGKGTPFNENVVDKTYARLDGGSSAPGYFTKERDIYTVYDEATQTLTYRYDNDYRAVNTYHELYDPINSPNALRFMEYHDQVKKAVIDSSMKEAPLISTYRMFYGGYNSETDEEYNLTQMTTIEGLENLNTTKTTFMAAMFWNCFALKSLDFSSFDTSNVMFMTAMFYRCDALTSLDLTSFNISKVTGMDGMFAGCTALTTIYCADDWSKSTTLTDSKGMFTGCEALVGGEGTAYNSSYTDATYARLDGGLKAPGYFTSKSKAKKVYTVFDPTKQTLTYRYDNDYYLSDPFQELYDPINNPNALRFEAYHDQVKKAIIDPSIKEAPLTSMRRMFYGGHNSETSEYYALTNMTAIEGLENLNTAQVTSIESMFNRCSSLTSLDLSSFNTTKVKAMGWMFDGCSGLRSIDLSSFNTSNVTVMEQMFYGCSGLTSLDLSSFDVSKVKYTDFMFYACKKLTTIYCADDWSTSATLTSSKNMFYNCKALVGGKGTTYDAEVVDKTYARPDDGAEAPGYFTKREVYTVYNSKKKTLTYYYDDKRESRTGVTELYDPVKEPNAIRFTGYYDQVKKAVIDPSMKSAPLKSMRNMFYGGFNDEGFHEQSLSAMTTIEGLENLNTAHVTDMYRMFYYCQSLTSIDLSAFNTSNVTDMYSMFIGCKGLQTLNLTSFDISKVANMRQMFASCSGLTTIYCNGYWNESPALTDSYMMFYGCNKLVGGQGTVLIEDKKMDATYARPDGGLEAPGYFTIPATLKGDADCDGEVTSADIVAMTDYIMGNPPADFSKANADVNLDGVINIADIVAVSNIIMNN
ncbi:MAG: BspA family leucine-rich repeat surface protein [Prevotella sp.]|nr:BspA family leucine-rich repeat surface protein [Prevotella sp.]